MKKGISLHIGLNSINPVYYGDPGTLKNPENDANAMEQLAVGSGFKPTKLLTKAATANNVLSEIYQAASKLAPGDTFLLTYAGHGAQVRDLNNEEEDGYDETWVLYDRMLLDDELYNAWSRFNPGVRVIVLSDSCHSGTVVRFFDMNKLEHIYFPDKNKEVYRCLEPKFALPAFENNLENYKSIKFALRGDAERAIMSTVLLISGCQDNQLSSDGDRNGLFTAQLLNTWNAGSFKGSYKTFHARITSGMPSIQVPNYYMIGIQNPAFEAEIPFTIDTIRDISSNGIGEINNRLQRAVFNIEIPKDELINLTEDDLKLYLSQKGGEILYDTYKKVSEAAETTIFTRASGGLDIGCKVEKDKWSCEGRLSIRF